MLETPHCLQPHVASSLHRVFCSSESPSSRGTVLLLAGMLFLHASAPAGTYWPPASHIILLVALTVAVAPWQSWAPLRDMPARYTRFFAFAVNAAGVFVGHFSWGCFGVDVDPLSLLYMSNAPRIPGPDDVRVLLPAHRDKGKNYAWRPSSHQSALKGLRCLQGTPPSAAVSILAVAVLVASKLPHQSP